MVFNPVKSIKRKLGSLVKKGGSTGTDNGENGDQRNNKQQCAVVPQCVRDYLDPELVNEIEALPSNSTKRREITAYFDWLNEQGNVDLNLRQLMEALREILNAPEPAVEAEEQQQLDVVPVMPKSGRDGGLMTMLKLATKMQQDLSIDMPGSGGVEGGCFQQSSSADSDAVAIKLMQSSSSTAANFANTQLEQFTQGTSSDYNQSLDVLSNNKWSGTGWVGCAMVARIKEAEMQMGQTMIKEHCASQRHQSNNSTKINIEKIDAQKTVALKNLDNVEVALKGQYGLQHQKQANQLEAYTLKMGKILDNAADKERNFWKDKADAREMKIQEAERLNTVLKQMKYGDNNKEREHCRIIKGMEQQHQRKMKKMELDHEHRMRKLDKSKDGQTDEEFPDDDDDELLVEEYENCEDEKE